MFDPDTWFVVVGIMHISCGSQLGPYRVDDLIATGGMSEVYRAYDTRLDRDVAVKVLAPALSADPDWRARFTHEAQTAALLNHPNIVAVHDAGSHLGLPFVVSELLDGSTLRARIGRGRLPIAVGLTYATQIARGVAAVHRAGVVHRDLKPENIFITRDGRVKILDFGLAKCRDDRRAWSREASVSTPPGIVLGSVGYMSPEQVRGDQVDDRSDTFSLGVILYEMTTGIAPFQRGEPVETLHAILKEMPASLRELRPEAPPMLDRIVCRCLNKDRHARFQSAADLAFALELVGDTLDDAATSQGSAAGTAVNRSSSAPACS